MPVVASAGGSRGAGRASSHRSPRPGALRRTPARPGSPPGFPLARLARAVATSGAALSAAVGLSLVARRLSGGLPRPDGAAALVVTTVIAVGLVALADRLRPRPFAARFASRLGLAMAMAALVPPLAFRGGAAIGLLATIGCLAAGTAAILRPLRDGRVRAPAGRSARRRPRRAVHDRRRESPARVPVEAAVPSPHGPAEAGPLVDHDASEPASSPVAAPTAPPPAAWRPAESGTLVLQRFERVLEAGGPGEVVRGTILLRVAAGSRSAVGHVGFCPPFAQVPRVEAGTTCEEVEATVVAAEVLPWGVRVECRLDEAADASIDVPVDIVARCSAPAAPPDAAPA